MSEIGGWGGGVFNGGAWLTVEGRRVGVHYRELDVVEHELAEVEEGRFRVEPLAFHRAGIPSYLVVAELAVDEVLRGRLPRPAAYSANHAPKDHRTEVAGAISVAAMQAGHAVLAAKGECVTNEKRLLERAGLRGVDDIIASLGDPSEPAGARAVDDAEMLFEVADRNSGTRKWPFGPRPVSCPCPSHRPPPAIAFIKNAGFPRTVTSPKYLCPISSNTSTYGGHHSPADVARRHRTTALASTGAPCHAPAARARVSPCRPGSPMRCAPSAGPCPGTRSSGVRSPPARCCWPAC